MTPKHPITCGKCRSRFVQLAETVAYSHLYKQTSGGQLRIEGSSDDYEEILGVFATCYDCGYSWKTRMSGIHEHPDWIG